MVIEDAAHAHGASVPRPPRRFARTHGVVLVSVEQEPHRRRGRHHHHQRRLRWPSACRSIHNCGRVPDGVWYEHHVISGNYRLGEFQGAILNCQLDRLEEQTNTRDGNGQYLASRLSTLPGIHPQRRPAECTRHSYHLFMLRLDAAAFGAPREMVLEALEAEGIPCSGGYGFSLPRSAAVPQQGVRPVPPERLRAARLLHGALPQQRPHLPRAVHLARSRRLMLGSRDDMDDIARAFEKVHEHRDALSRICMFDR